MNLKKYLVFGFLIFITGLTHAQELEQYRLSSDDVISISVFDEPDLSLRDVRLSVNGSIAMPLIGQVILKNMTVSEAERSIEELYRGEYLKKPDVTVTIVEYRQFYVNGEVKKPGGYSYRDGMTVQRAITLAGGFTERASVENIKLVRESNQEKPDAISLATKVKPGDVITVNESFF